MSTGSQAIVEATAEQWSRYRGWFLLLYAISVTPIALLVFHDVEGVPSAFLASMLVLVFTLVGVLSFVLVRVVSDTESVQTYARVRAATAAFAISCQTGLSHQST